MSKTKTTRQELIDWIDRRDPFGVDAVEREHYWFPARQLVTVTVDNEIVHVADVANLERWKDFVDERVGWEWNRWTDKTIVDLLLDVWEETDITHDTDEEVP